jgi:hypothetical protein
MSPAGKSVLMASAQVKKWSSSCHADRHASPGLFPFLLLLSLIGALAAPVGRNLSFDGKDDPDLSEVCDDQEGLPSSPVDRRRAPQQVWSWWGSPRIPHVSPRSHGLYLYRSTAEVVLTVDERSRQTGGVPLRC